MRAILVLLQIMAATGLVVSIVGVIILTRASPTNVSDADGGEAGTDHAAQTGEDERRNRLIGLGLRLVVMGTSLQVPAAVAQCFQE